MLISTDRAQALLKAMEGKSIAVVGDFFLDKYLLIDSGRDEPSLETGLTAYQVTGRRLYPGAAGTVAKNLTALGVGKVFAVSVIGNDGEGFELKRELTAQGVDISHIIEDSRRMTPTYTKPMRSQGDDWEESNRLDFKNFTPMPADLRGKIIQTVRALSSKVDAIIALDQVCEAECGVLSGDVREAIAQIGAECPEKVVYADSRAFIDVFRNMIVKCNNLEVVKAVFPDHKGDSNPELLAQCARELVARNKKPVFITQGEKGQIVADGEELVEVPAVRLEGPLDICGAGDATTAGIVSALCCGASLAEAAALGNIVASITIQKLNVTGEASPAEVIERVKSLA